MHTIIGDRENREAVCRTACRQQRTAIRLGIGMCALMMGSCSHSPTGVSHTTEDEADVSQAASDADGLHNIDLDFTTIERCARFSKAVYHRPGTAEYESQKEQYEKDFNFVLWDEFKYDVFLMKDTRTLKSFLLLRDDDKKEQFICVAGTDGYADWKVNIEYPLKDKLTGTGIFVHPQFGGLATELYNKKLKDQLKEDYKTVVTGHSLGGAVAAIIGMLIERDGKGDLQHVYTFGQPKFTNAFGDSGVENSSGIFVQRHFPLLRIVNSGDPVPKLPQYSLLKEFVGKTGRYAHLGDELVLTGEGRGRFERFLNDDGSINEEHIEKSDVTDLLETVSSIRDVEQHKMDVYVQNIASHNQ